MIETGRMTFQRSDPMWSFTRAKYPGEFGHLNFYRFSDLEFFVPTNCLECEIVGSPWRENRKQNSVNNRINIFYFNKIPWEQTNNPWFIWNVMTFTYSLAAKVRAMDMEQMVHGLQWCQPQRFQTRWSHRRILYKVGTKNQLWHSKIPIFNRKCIFKWWIFHCHVSFRRCEWGEITLLIGVKQKRQWNLFVFGHL